MFQCESAALFTHSCRVSPRSEGSDDGFIYTALRPPIISKIITNFNFLETNSCRVSYQVLNLHYKSQRLNKKMKFPNPTSFMAQDKSVIEHAYPGDVIGLYDTGNFKIGDTLTEGEKMMFKGIPSFSPEIFQELENLDPMKSKQLDKGVRQLIDEGVAQLFIQQPGNRKIVGTVGQLQFEVINYRLINEYGAKCRFVPRNYFKACWITTDNEAQLETFKKAKHILHCYNVFSVIETLCGG